MSVFTTRNKAPNYYSADAWITNGGAALGINADPTNLASVPVNRRVANGRRPLTSGTTFTCFIVDGTSTCTIRFWWYDASMDLWIPDGSGGALTTGGANMGLALSGNTPGAIRYLQVTANAGGTTQIALVYR
jgi:hypothetical protein